MNTYTLKNKNIPKLPQGSLVLKRSAVNRIDRIGYYMLIFSYVVIIGIYSTLILIQKYISGFHISSPQFNYAKMRRNVIKISSALLIVDVVFSFIFIRNLSTPIRAEESTSLVSLFSPLISTSASGGPVSVAVGTDTALLMTALGKEGFTPLALEKINNEKFSVPGTMITLGTDNISVFEYGDQEMALGQASLLAKKDNDSLTKNAWSEQAHIYTKGTLIIYYLGTQSLVAQTLTHLEGESLILSNGQV